MPLTDTQGGAEASRNSGGDENTAAVQGRVSVVTANIIYN